MKEPERELGVYKIKGGVIKMADSVTSDSGNYTCDILAEDGTRKRKTFEVTVIGEYFHKTTFISYFT